MNAGAAASHACHLLLIEDERSVMEFIRTALERNGYACSTANSAAEGIRTWKQAALAESSPICVLREEPAGPTCMPGSCSTGRN